MKTMLWLLVAAAGFGLMLFSAVAFQGPASPPSASDGQVYVAPAPFYTFAVGQALLFLGCSFLLVRLCTFLAPRVRSSLLGAPLVEIHTRRRLFLTLALVYFGLAVLFAVVVYQVPDVQRSLVATVRKALKTGPLVPVAQAYASRSIVRAALMTVAINFTLGSFAVITLPSLIVPGVGALMAVLRAALWGLVLAPTNPLLLRRMAPHSLTMFLEGAGYVLAGFFALLVPIYLLRRSEGETVLRRYGKAVVVNLKGNLLVLIVLAVSAVYEAVEVILQS